MKLLSNLKYWWWRVWVFRKEKVKISFALPNEFPYEKGDVVQIGFSGQRMMCIGKNYFIPYYKGKLIIK